MKHFIAALAATTAVMGVNARDNAPLHIYSGVKDTLTTPSTTIVCVTRPGATATVNGRDVHVYRTGSFGTRVDLQPGDNTIDIKVVTGGQEYEHRAHIYYNDKAVAEPAVAKDDATHYIPAPFYVTTLPGAYLQYGNGDDRLGGSKMGFVDKDITLQVIGTKGSLYCVRLAKDRVAYIPKEYTAPTSSVTRTVNTGSWSITGEGDRDRLTIALPERLPYQYMTSQDPCEITVDIFGATDNSNWVTQRTLDLGMIDFTQYRQVSEDVYRVIIRLKKEYNWGFSVGYGDKGSVLAIDVRHQPRTLSLKGMTIGLDAGHGGEYPGAISPSGLKEKDMNLDIVRRIETLLEKRGARVVLTRDGDTGPSMGERKRIWRDNNVDLAISVHNNSGGSPLSSPGTAVLYKHDFDRPLALCLTRRMVQTGLPLFGLVGNFNFSLNGPTECPNALIEGMFMSSLEEEEKLASPEFRQLVAEKIVAGIEDYLQEVKKANRP